MPGMHMPPLTVLMPYLSSRNGRSLPIWTLNVFANCWPFRWCWMEEICILLKRCPGLGSLITVWDGLMGKIGLWILPWRTDRSSCGQFPEIRKNLYINLAAIAVYCLTLI